MQISLRPISRQDFDLVRHLTVEPDQVLFSGTVAQAFKTQREGVDFHAILASPEICDEAEIVKEFDPKPVGFFKIDRSYGIAQPNELGLCAFLIDRQHQGKGIATQTIRQLPTYLPLHYPKHTSLMLTVDLKNSGAIASYQNGGLATTGQLYFGGILGPQHVMRMPLASPN